MFYLSIYPLPLPPSLRKTFQGAESIDVPGFLRGRLWGIWRIPGFSGFPLAGLGGVPGNVWTPALVEFF